MITRKCIRLTSAGLVMMLALVASAFNAVAGEFYEKSGAAIRGYDPVAYFTEKKPVQGSPSYKAEFRGTQSTSRHRQIAMLSQPRH